MAEGKVGLAIPSDHFPVDKSVGAVALQHKRNYRQPSIETGQSAGTGPGVALHIGELREQAQRCWRLAQAIYNAEAVAELEAYARQLEQRAERLESEHVPEPPTTS